jgi:hypothetical protein
MRRIGPRALVIALAHATDWRAAPRKLCKCPSHSLQTKTSDADRCTRRMQATLALDEASRVLDVRALVTGTSVALSKAPMLVTDAIRKVRIAKNHLRSFSFGRFKVVPAGRIKR